MRGGTADSDALFGLDIAKSVVNAGNLELTASFQVVATSSAPGETPYVMTVPAVGSLGSSKYFPEGYPVEICEVDPAVSIATWTYLLASTGGEIASPLAAGLLLLGLGAGLTLARLLRAGQQPRS